MRFSVTVILITAMVSLAAPFGLGMGLTVISEKQSDIDYGWTGTIEAGTSFIGLDWGTRVMGSIYYPTYSNHPGMSALGLMSATVLLEPNSGLEVGGGMQFRTEEVRVDGENASAPVLYLGWRFDLASGHTIRPFCLFSQNERETIQSGFLVSFGR